MVVVETEDEEKAMLRRHGYKAIKTMGEGSYSKVKKCTVDAEVAKVGKGESAVAVSMVAIKIIDRRRASERFLNIFLPRELAISSSVRHPNIASTLDHFTEGPRTVVVMELASRGDLEQYISLRGALADRGDSNDLSHSVFRQIIVGVNYLHGRGIVHRDLKCENVFLDYRNVVKIGDFGFSREMKDDQRSMTYCGSRAYVAPELLQQIPYKGKPADCWSLGVILFIMLEARMPFDDRDPPKMLRRQLDKRVPFTTKTGKLARAMVLALLDPVVDDRLTAVNAFAHPWFAAASTSPSPAPSPSTTTHDTPSPSASATSPTSERTVTVCPQATVVTIVPSREEAGTPGPSEGDPDPEPGLP